MKYTNKLGLPAPIVRALEAAEYDGPPSDGRTISVTSLIGPARIRGLAALHEGDMTTDASDAIHLLMGISWHQILRVGAELDAKTEMRLEAPFRGWTISGQIDHYREGVISDWKTVSTWAVLLGIKPEWEQQLNLYAFLMRKQGFKVETIQIVAFLKDLNEVKKSMKKSRNPRPVPSSPVLVIPQKMWSPLETEAFIAGRLEAHEQALQGELPLCTEEETWKGRRCAEYCSVAPFCTQFNGLKDSYWETEP